MRFWDLFSPSEQTIRQILFSEEETLRRKGFELLVKKVDTELKSKVRNKYTKMISKALYEEAVIKDICQETFLRYWNDLKKPQKRDELSTKPFVPWLLRIAENVIHENNRKENINYKSVYETEKHDSSQQDENGMFGIYTDIEMDKMEVFSELMKAFLPNQRGNCLEIFEGTIEGLSQKEIAEMLNTTENTIKEQNKRCKEKMRKMAKEKGFWD